MLRMDSRACKAGAPVSKPLTTGRSKNVVLIAVNGGKKRQKKKNDGGSGSSDFGLTRQLPSV